MYDVIIVGAGPAGLFAAYELINKNNVYSYFVHSIYSLNFFFFDYFNITDSGIRVLSVVIFFNSLNHVPNS